MKTVVVVVHGVGFFEEDKVIEQVRTQLQSLNSFADQILAYNWDKRTTTFFDRVSSGKEADLKFLKDVGAGTLHATHLGFLSQVDKYADIPAPLIKIHNFLSLALQILCLVVAAFLCLNFTLLWLPFSWLSTVFKIVGSLGLFIIGVGAVSGHLSRQSISASFRRVVLALVWPIVYCCGICIATPIYLLIAGLISSALAVVYFSKRWGIIFFSEVTGTFTIFLDMAVYLAGVIVLFSLAIVVGFALQRITQPFFKVVADVVRYIGLDGYRRTILGDFQDLLKKIPDARSAHLVILAHSLGSVIATDCLSTKRNGRVDFRAISLITMGSPLRRMFWRFFPEICGAPEAIGSFLHKELPDFQWVNIHRRFDYIGGRLTRNSDCIRETTIPSWTRGHTNYWEEEILGRTVKMLLMNRNKQPDSCPDQIDEVISPCWPPNLTEASEDSAFTWIWRRRDRVVRVLPKLLFPFAIFWFVLRLYQFYHLGLANPHADSQVAGVICASSLFRMYDKRFRDSFLTPWVAILFGSSEGLPRIAEIPSAERPSPTRLLNIRILFALSVSLLILCSAAVAHIYQKRTWTLGVRSSYPIEPRVLVFSKDATLLVASGRGVVAEFPVKSFTQVAAPTFKPPNKWPIIDIGPDLQNVLTVEGHGGVFLHHVDDLGQVEPSGVLIANKSDQPRVGPQGTFLSIAFHLANPPSVSLVDTSTHKIVHSVSVSADLPFYPPLVAFSPDGQCLAIVQRNYIIEIKDFKNARDSSFKVTTGKEIVALAYSNGCEYVGLAYSDSIEVYDRKRKKISHQVLTKPLGSLNTPTALVFWPKDNHVIVSGDSLGISFWDWTGHRYLHPAAD